MTTTVNPDTTSRPDSEPRSDGPTRPDGTTHPGARAVIDTITVARRDLQHWRHVLGAKVFGWVWPLIIMGMMVGLLGGALGDALGDSYLDFVMPGVLAMTMFFGLEGTMLAMCQDASRGITDRFRSLPVSGFAVVGGRCVTDLLDSLISLALVTAAGLAFGWRPEVTVGGAMTVLVLLVLLRIAMLWLGIYIGLKASTPEALTPVNIAIWPVLFMSSVFIDTATMPTWLGWVADANPLSATATAVRERLGSPVAEPGTWFAEYAEPLSVVWPVLLTVLFCTLSIRAYRGLRR